VDLNDQRATDNNNILCSGNMRQMKPNVLLLNSYGDNILSGKKPTTTSPVPAQQTPPRHVQKADIARATAKMI